MVDMVKLNADYNSLRTKLIGIINEAVAKSPIEQLNFSSASALGEISIDSNRKGKVKGLEIPKTETTALVVIEEPSGIIGKFEIALLSVENLLYICSILDKADKVWYWRAESDDGWNDSSHMLFDNYEDCYYDMRDAALEKMKWNTDIEDLSYPESNSIDYKVTFQKDCITHTSYSGTYVYRIYQS